MQCNINQQCSAVLTEAGVKAVLKYWDGDNPFDAEVGKPYRDTLWQFMATFGPSIHMTGPVLFQDNEMSIEKEL